MRVLFWIVVTLIFEVNSDVYPSNGSVDISMSYESEQPSEKENSYRVYIHKIIDKSVNVILKFDADVSVKLSDKSFARIRHEESNTFILSFDEVQEDIVLKVQGLTPGVIPYFKSIVINTVEYCKDPSVPADNSTNICRKLQAARDVGAAGSTLRVDLTIEYPEVIHSPPTACLPHSATCQNGQCIPKSTICDGIFDCSDGSDEESCNQNEKCERNEFMCANRKCVMKTFLCDSEDDCGDGSDEQNCVRTESDQCRSTEFACASNDQCVPKSFRCDGLGDCLDKSDEIGCRPESPRPLIFPRGEMRVQLGTQFELHCIVRGGIPQPVVTWYRNRGTNFSEHVQILDQNNTLSFQSVEINDEGEYTCSATANDVESVSESTIIIVETLPVITISPNEYILVKHGDRVEVICRADGYPEPKVSIRSVTGRYPHTPPALRSATLIITSASEGGSYICTATSDSGTTDKWILIQVDGNYDVYPDGSGDNSYDPNPPEGSSSMLTFGGYDIRIRCNASEEFRVIWDRGPGQDLQNNTEQNGKDLIIYNTSKNDSGLYGCTLVNLHTTEVKKSTQTILEVIELPRITLRPPTQTVYSGQSPTVECIVEGQDTFSLTWNPPSIAFSSRVEIRGSTLIFHQIEVEDAGKYECFVVNKMSYARSAIAEVIVNGSEAPRVLIYPQGENWVTLGTQYELDCIVEGGIPQPAVTWYRNDGRNFSEHVQTLGQNNTLSFQTIKINDEGEYTCSATNYAGSVNASAIIKVGFPPVITISPNEYIRVKYGDRVEVICRADGYPEPEVSIRSNTGRYLWVPTSLRSATLTIRSVRNDGTYTCTAISAVGTTEKQFFIRVEANNDAFPINSAGFVGGCLYGGVALLWRKGLFPNLTGPDCGDNIQGYLDALISGYRDRVKASRRKTSNNCGRRKITHTQLIVDGSPTKAGDWPWHAALYRLDQSQIKYICGGTLISNYFVLTAAHCTSIRGEMLLPETLSVILGKFNLVGGDTGTQEKQVHQIIMHNEFEYQHSNNDIALLKLRTEAVYTDYVQPACLWYPKVHEKLPTNEIFGAVAGWGFDITDNLSHQLVHAKMPVVPDSTCIKSNPLFYGSLLKDNKFCAGYKNGTSACNGDSGGAFQVFVPDEAKDNSSKAAGAWYIKGIVSVTLVRTDAPICDPEQYVVFTDVAKYLHWIEKNTK